MAKKSGVKNSSLFRKLREWTSCIHWASWLTNWMNRLVRRKIVVIFGFFEICVCSGCFYFFYRNNLYHALSALLRIKFGRHFMLPFIAIRILSGAFLLCAACKRSTRLMRYYFVMLILNTCTITLIMGPLARTTCQCKSYWQCEVLLAFMGKTDKLVNPWPLPNQRKFKNKGAVPRKPPPEPLHAAEEQSRQGGRRLHEAPEFDLEYGRNSGTLVGQTVDSHFPADLRSEFETQYRRLESHRYAGIAGEQNRSDRPADLYAYFDLTAESISWVPAHTSNWRCYEFRLTIQVFKLLRGRFVTMQGCQVQDIVDTIQHPEQGKVESILSYCKNNKMCAIVQVILVENATNATDKRMKWCNLMNPCVPIPSDMYISDVLTRFPEAKEFHQDLHPGPRFPHAPTIFFQKNFSKVATDEATHTVSDDPMQSSAQAFMANILAQSSDKHALKMLDEKYLDTCRCRSGSDSGGCSIFFDEGRRKTEHWCVVADDSLGSCRNQGIKLFPMPIVGGKRQGTYWSTDLCRRRGCKCSGIGMFPNKIERSHWKFDHVPELLVKNGTERKALYGTRCEAWNKEDVEKRQMWCFVNYDSTCKDRELVESSKAIDEELSDTAHGMVTHQYRSIYYCMKDDHQKQMLSQKDVCQVTVACVLTTMILLTLSSLPMGVIVFKFLVRRCGDHFAIEAQFDAYFSSESENEDDFNISASDKLPGQPKRDSMGNSTFASQQELELAEMTGGGASADSR